MRIKNRNWRGITFLALVVFCLAPVFSRAVTVELEEDEDVAAAPTETPVVNKPKTEKAPAQASVQAAQSIPIPSAESLKARVRINDKIGFYYFVRAGFMTRNPEQVHSIGRVVGSFNNQNQTTFNTPHKTYIDLISSKADVKPGDLLVVSRAVQWVEEPRSNFSSFWVQNVGIVKVVEVDKKRCLVEVKEAFSPILIGDKVRFYDDETERWKQAQIKKNLPDHPVKCFVAGGGLNQSRFNQTDWIILTAGSSKGVVEGQRLQLREYQETGAFQPVLQTLQGQAQVFYAGENYSMAQIIFSHISIQKSFEAVYQP